MNKLNTVSCKKNHVPGSAVTLTLIFVICIDTLERFTHVKFQARCFSGDQMKKYPLLPMCSNLTKKLQETPGVGYSWVFYLENCCQAWLCFDLAVRYTISDQNQREMFYLFSRLKSTNYSLRFFFPSIYSCISAVESGCNRLQIFTQSCYLVM